MRKVRVENLCPGMKVARPVYDAMGFLLLNAGVELKREYIENLKKLQIPAVYIIDSLIPDVEIEDIILDETRQKAYLLIRKILQNAGKQGDKSSPSLLFTGKEIASVLDEIISHLLNNPNLIVNLTDIRTVDNYTFAHSVNVAVLAITIGISLGLSRSELKKIGLGAFLHDLGKTRIPWDILNKGGSLSSREFTEIKKHPLYGYEIFKAQGYNDSSSAMVIYQHHESKDGSGYPEGVKGEEIHLFARICKAVDIYDALVSDRPYRPAFLPHEAMEILGTKSEELDLLVLQKFFQHVAAYPVGTLVGLSNGKVGIVVHNTAGFPTRPRVRVFCSKENYEQVVPHEIDLVETMNVVVDKVYKEGELPEHLLRKLGV